MNFNYLFTAVLDAGLLILQSAFTLAADCSTDANQCSIFELCDAAVENTSGKPMWSTRTKDQKYVDAAKNWIKKSPYTNCGVPKLDRRR